MRRATLFIAILIGLTGCTWTDGATRTSLVLGIGIVTTTDRGDGPVRVRETGAFGALAIDTPDLRGVIVGGASVSRLDIETDRDVLIERWKTNDGRAHVRVRPMGEPTQGDME